MQSMDSTAPLVLWDEIDDHRDFEQTANDMRKPFSLSKKTDQPIDEKNKKNARDIALRLLKSVDPSDDPTKAYSKLLEQAIYDAAQAEEARAKLEDEIDRLKRASVTDELTGALNRRGFRRELERSLERARRQNESGLLLMIDLNDFKEINDTFGHEAGDLVLSSVSAMLQHNTRVLDIVARLGGDEFAVVLTNTDPILGKEKALILDYDLNHMEVSWNGNKISVSGSIGVEPYDKNTEIEALLHNADMRMYDLKRDSKTSTKNPSEFQPAGYPYLGK